MKLEDVKKLLDALTEENRNYPHIADSLGYDSCNLSQEESDVFELYLQEWPQFLSLLMVYQVAIGVTEYNLDDEAVKTIRDFANGLSWLEDKVVDPEQFSKFGKLFGYSFRELDALYHKHHFFLVREKIVSYKDENEENESPSDFDPDIDFSDISGQREDVKKILDELTERNKSHPHITEYGYDWCSLELEESAIFELSLQEWPQFLSLWMVYQVAIGLTECDLDDKAVKTMGLMEYDLDDEAVKTMGLMEYDLNDEAVKTIRDFANGLSWLEDKVVDREQFSKFGKLFGYSFRELYALYHKQHFFLARERIVLYKDEDEEYESPSDFGL